jgi:hypothetical protein
MTLSKTAVSGNTAGDGGVPGTATNNGISSGGAAGGGGGIAAAGATGELEISDSQITGNRAGSGGASPGFVATARGADGGGIWLVGFGPATIERTSIVGNRAGDGAAGAPGGGGGFGGGIMVTALVDLTLRDSVVSGNAAGDGGDGRTFVGVGDGGNGGGIYLGVSSNHSFALTNVTVAGNSSGAGGDEKLEAGSQGGHGGLGGGIYAFGIGTFTHVTVASNQTGAGGAGEVPGARGVGGGIHSAGEKQTIANSIFASNSPGNCNMGAGAIVDGGHDVSFPDATCPGINGNPLLGPLLSAGGPTQTMGLAEGSSAIDIVPASGANCAAADQRGVPRPQRAACDAGAYEAVAIPAGPLDEHSLPVNPLPPGATDKTRPVIKLLLRKQKLRIALKKGYFCFFTDNELGTAVADLFATGKTAKGTAAAKRKRVAHGALRVRKTGKQKLVVRFTKKAKTAFKKRRKVTLTLVLTAKDAAGNVTRKTAKVTLKR